jgi:hypothetical protein
MRAPTNKTASLQRPKIEVPQDKNGHELMALTLQAAFADINIHKC